MIFAFQKGVYNVYILNQTHGVDHEPKDDLYRRNDDLYFSDFASGVF